MKSTSTEEKALDTDVKEANDAGEQVMTDLINSLLAEGFWDQADAEVLSRRQWEAVAGNAAGMPAAAAQAGPDDPLMYRWWTGRERGEYVCFPIRAAVVQPYRYVKTG
ncbi:hypothetical protein K0U00_46395, partial [Paenibacillus sepulcri]|nr:hypothetical protein [Paenibacillus sepulcri]